MRAFNFSTSREQPKEERKSRGRQRGSSSLGKHVATEGAAGTPLGRGHRAQAARRGRTSPNFRAAGKKGGQRAADRRPRRPRAKEGAAAWASTKPQREQQGSGQHTRGGQPQTPAAREGRGAQESQSKKQPGAGNPTDGARATGKRTGAGKPQGSHQHRAQAAPRRSPAARSSPHAAANTQQSTR